VLCYNQAYAIFSVADAFDFVGFLLLAWFNGFVSRRQKDILVYAIYYLNWMFIDTLVSLSIVLILEDRVDNSSRILNNSSNNKNIIQLKLNVANIECWFKT